MKRIWSILQQPYTINRAARNPITSVENLKGFVCHSVYNIVTNVALSSKKKIQSYIILDHKLNLEFIFHTTVDYLVFFFTPYETTSAHFLCSHWVAELAVFLEIDV